MTQKFDLESLKYQNLFGNPRKKHALDYEFGAAYELYWSKNEKTKVSLFNKVNDFIVQEIFDGKPLNSNLIHRKTKNLKSNKGKWIYFTLVKKKISTFDCAKIISDYFNIEEKSVQYCGLKDNFAIASQKISIEYNNSKAPIKNFYKFKKFFLKDGKVADRPLFVGAHSGNKFIVTVKMLGPDSLETIKERINFLAKNGVPNFYGVQRFGPRKVNHIIGFELVHRNFEQAAKVWLTNICYDWKKGARIKRNWGNWKKCLEIVSGDPNLSMEVRFFQNLSENYSFEQAFASIPLGNFFVRSFRSFLFNKALTKIIISNRQVNTKFRLEAVGYGTKFSKPSYSIYQKILDSYKIKVQDFNFSEAQKLTTIGDFRSAFFIPKNIKIKEHGRNILLSFELKNGCFATIFLNQLFNNQNMHMSSRSVIK